MTKMHKALLVVSALIVLLELGALFYYFDIVSNWVSHNLWIVIVPFLKAIFKKILTLKLLLFFKATGSLVFNLFKLLLMKVFKTLTIRYGVFFSQRKWRWMRWCKVIFLRKGRLLFGALKGFWAVFSRRQKMIVWFAFFPVVMLLFFLGFSFNVTRKTMVQKTQETSIFKAAVSATNSSKGVRGWITRLDRKVLAKIKSLTLK